MGVFWILVISWLTVFSSFLFLAHARSPSGAQGFGSNHTTTTSLLFKGALYIFGDSFLDAGNNNHLKTRAKVNFTPYGIDFPQGPTGRFTNGYTIADYFAIWLHLSLPPPYLNANSLKSNNLVGFNYASGSAGILPETGSVAGENLSMGKQVELFRTTVEQYLPYYYNSPEKLSQHLSKSIFILLIGANDYVNNYFLRQLPAYNRSLHYTSEEFSQLIVNQLGQYVQKLYLLGARKFVVSNLVPVDQGNTSAMFNSKLVAMMDEARSKLYNSVFVMFNLYQVSLYLVQNHSCYGITDLINPCCNPCNMNQVPCKNRASHLRWDMAHFTQAAYKVAAAQCFSGTAAVCTPMTLLELASMKA